MRALKGVVFSLRNVIVRRGRFDTKIFAELERLVLWLRNRGVQPVFVGNHPWVTTDPDGKTEDLKDVLTKRWGQCPWYIAAHGDMPFKPKASSMEYVLQAQGWEHNEAIYIGNTDDDMRTARNGRLLFLNAVWHGEASPYGYRFNSPLDVARFIDCFCLGATEWFWAIERGQVRVYAVAPFSTLSARYSDAQVYSAHARNTAKHFGGDATFWGRLLASRVYFSGLVDELDYITPYPGHSPSSQQPVVGDALTILADSLQKRYLPNLILRHAMAIKSQTARTSGGSVDHVNQLNTIHLNSHPDKDKQGGKYVSSPSKGGKMVLVVDDFCTQGNSFEAARSYIERTGARAICMSWLKTINTDYQMIIKPPAIVDPYMPNRIAVSPPQASIPYSSAIRNSSAMSNLQEVFRSYYDWQWPPS
jgi:hypothetical protein